MRGGEADVEDWEAAPGDRRSIDPTTSHNYNFHARAPEEESTRPFGRKLLKAKTASAEKPQVYRTARRREILLKSTFAVGAETKGEHDVRTGYRR